MAVQLQFVYLARHGEFNGRLGHAGKASGDVADHAAEGAFTGEGLLSFGEECRNVGTVVEYEVVTFQVCRNERPGPSRQVGASN